VVVEGAGDVAVDAVAVAHGATTTAGPGRLLEGSKMVEVVKVAAKAVARLRALPRAAAAFLEGRPQTAAPTKSCLAAIASLNPEEGA